MRILLCCESYFPAGGGVARVNQEIGERLAARGHDVTVATSMAEALSSSEEVRGVSVERFRVSGNTVRGIKGEKERYQDFVVSGGFDSIFIYAAQQWTFDALWPALPSVRARKIHVPCGYSGLYDPSYKDYFRRMPQVLRQFDHLVFHASDYRDVNFAREAGISNFSIIPNGAGEDEFENSRRGDLRRKMGIGEDEFVFLTVGNPPLQKGHGEVTLAYSQFDLPFPSVLILNGAYGSPTGGPLPGNALRRLRRQAAGALKRLRGRTGSTVRDFEKGVEQVKGQDGKRILMVDLPRPQLLDAFFSSNLFVFASHIEYSPLVLFEAAAAGLPFLSVPVGNAEEIVRWTEGGEICPAATDRRGYTVASPPVLAGSMKRLATDKDRLGELGRLGRDNWRRGHTWEKIVARYEEVLTKGEPLAERDEPRNARKVRAGSVS